jgi:hypothetical protein
MLLKYIAMKSVGLRLTRIGIGAKSMTSSQLSSSLIDFHHHSPISILFVLVFFIAGLDKYLKTTASLSSPHTLFCVNLNVFFKLDFCILRNENLK